MWPLESVIQTRDGFGRQGRQDEMKLLVRTADGSIDGPFGVPRHF